jgi:predicted Zn finger-like uncharacterized protein
MEVSCEKCKENYEFDDTRITEAGVTVKCTTCGHVFKVKRKAPMVTMSVNPSDGQMSVSPASIAAPPAGTGTFVPSVPGATPAPKDKEWKVRQANGNLFQFRELTTLQKWIVERKVTREDEISLNGDVWKRLGNIAELASFFQVVDEAQKAQQLQALHSAGALGYAPPGATPAGGYAVPSGDALQPQLGFPGPAAYRTAPPMQSGAMSATGMPPMQVPPQVNVTVHNPMAAPAPAPMPVSIPGPAAHAPHAAQLRHATDDDIAAAKLKKGGPNAALIALLVVAVLGGGGYVGYSQWWVPQQEAKEREDKALADAQRKAAEAEQEKKAAEAKLAEEEKAKKAADEAARAAAAAADAGTTTVVASAKQPRDFDGWMALGDRLRDREKAEAALDAYGRAADLNPDRAEPHAGRGLALMDMGQKLQAEAAFLQALKLNPRYGVALMGLAETYRNLGKNDEAKKYYEQYLDVLPSGPEAAVARQALQRLQQ